MENQNAPTKPETGLPPAAGSTNRRNFLRSILAAPMILPAATTYQRIWPNTRVLTEREALLECGKYVSYQGSDATGEIFRQACEIYEANRNRKVAARWEQALETTL